MTTTMSRTPPGILLGGPPKLEMITRSYMVKKAMENDRRYDVFHPSEWGKCQRKVAYRYYNHHHRFIKKAEHEVDLRVERIFDNGHSVHDRWKKYLISSFCGLRGCWLCSMCGKVYGRDEKIGVFNPIRCSCGKEGLQYEEILVRSEPKYNFEGHVDAVIDLRGSPYGQGKEHDVFVVDFKSMSDSYFSELRQAQHEHVVQTHVYMWLLGLQAAIIVYENKDNQTLKEMFIPRSEKLVSEIKDDSSLLGRLLECGKLPPRPDGFVRSRMPCRFCEFRDVCFG